MSAVDRSLDRKGAGVGTLERAEDTFRGSFRAMASPCEVLVDSHDRDLAEALLALAQGEADRIERKFSRYRDDSVVQAINRSAGHPLEVDDETAQLLDYADECHDVSDGAFDITSGALRRIWSFDGGERVPDEAAIQEVLRHVGWHRVKWANHALTLEPGMEIDFGGFGKEYAVDRAAALCAARTDRAFLLNFGGDLYASAPREGELPWIVGIDDPDRTGETAAGRIELVRGGLATSGDARRFVTWRGKRLSHILNPKTGWPIEDAPRSVTVLGATCLEAGTLSTLAFLRGPDAREFLLEQGVHFWVV